MAVLLSIQPKWCELISTGKKTVEIRKTKPKLETPFKCYIYCTKPAFPHEDYIVAFSSEEQEPKAFYGGGKVICEFVCDRICPIAYTMDGFADFVDCQTTCLNPIDFMNYGKGQTLYGWHISELVIYDKPKELSEFTVIDKEAVKKCKNRTRVYNNPDYTNGALLLGSYYCNKNGDWCSNCKTTPLKRPPQSWCYVE